MTETSDGGAERSGANPRSAVESHTLLHPASIFKKGRQTVPGRPKGVVLPGTVGY